MSEQLMLRPDTNFRQIRLHLPEGKFMIAKETVHTDQDLQNLLLKFKPLNTYMTNATFLSPTRIRGMRKGSYKYADKIILDHLVDVDIDLPGQQGMVEVRKTLEFFKNKPRYVLLEVTDSGGGKHAYFKDTVKPNIANPLDRLEWYKQERTALRQELEAAGIQFDGPILSNIFCISRVVGTENNNSTIDGQPTMCRRLSLEEVYSDAPQLIPQRKQKKPTKQPERKNPSLLLFITNKIPGVKDRYVPILMWHKDMDYKRYLKPNLKLGRVQIFKTENAHIGISCKSLSPERITKVYKKTHSSNIVAWEKYQHSWIPLARQTLNLSVEQIKESISTLRTEHNLNNFQLANVLKMEKLTYVETVDTSPVTYYASEPHLKYLEKFLGVQDQYNLVHGAGLLQPNLVLRSK